MNHLSLALLIGVGLVSAARTSAQGLGAWSSTDGFYRLEMMPSVQTTFWAGDSPHPALVDAPDDVFLAPRLQLETSAALGSHLFLHANARWDRGFDTGNEPDGEVRVDELFARWRFFEDERLSLQVGKFPTVFGAWVAQHDFFDDPFLLPPLAYSQVIGIQSRDATAMTPQAMADRADGSAPAFANLSKQNWSSIIWGPSYASGLALSGSTSRWDYAFEVKNAALSSHSDAWSPQGEVFSRPTVSARAGFRPNAAWAFGLSGSHGNYLNEAVHDLDQTTLGLDSRWAHHHWMISGEVIATRFETASAGHLDALAWHLQARYKLAPGLWLAARGGQLLCNSSNGPAGTPVRWSPDVWRVELALGWHLSPNILLKLDYSLTRTNGTFPAGEHLLGLGFGWRL
ncbi:MAG: hypothetical protein IPK22_01835 [Verrucomicrobiaceae bacterium]|nr:hypothetical protein [Verrucomicrobiaceae bacterium]